jgi:hypothetical protein
MVMSTDPRVSRPHPSFRPWHAIDRMQAAVIAALRRQATRERRALRSESEPEK